MTKAKSTIKIVAACIVVPMIYVAIGVFVVFSLTKPYIDSFQSVLGLLSQKKEVVTEIQDDLVLFTEENEDEEPIEKVDGKGIEFPLFGKKYALLEIPSLNVKADMYFGDSDAVLNKGVGQYIGSNIPGMNRPIMVAGHNNTYFHLIGNLVEGDIIRITTSYGIYEYSVIGTKLSNKDDTTAYDMNFDGERLTIYTCYPFNMLGLTSQRYFVYADKVSGPVIDLGGESK